MQATHWFPSGWLYLREVNGMKKGEAVQLDTADAQSAAEELAEILDSMGQSLSGIAQWDMSGVIESLDMLGEKISALSEELGMLQISDSTLGSFTEITNVFASLLAMLQAVCSDEKVVELFSVLGTFLTQTLIPVLKGVFDWVGAIFGGTSLGMIAAIAAAIVLVVVVITRSLDTIKARFSEIWENHIKPMWDGICEFNLIERTFKLEGQMEECQHDIRDLKAYHKPG
jgi:hypothetical protein